jgi:hypothetical protein
MARIPLTIGAISVLLACVSTAQQPGTTQPQVRSGTGAVSSQANPPKPAAARARRATPSDAAAQSPRKDPALAAPANPGMKPGAGTAVALPSAGQGSPQGAPTQAPPAAGGQTTLIGPPAPPASIPQVTRPADMPPVPPQVSYRNGMLTVNAVNSTMASVLNAIRSKTGIDFEGAENSGERVAVSLGPAPEGEVLAGIFSGSGFDYVVLGRADSPGIVQKVILTPKTKGGAVNAAAQPQAQQPQPQESEEDTPDETATAPDVEQQQPQDAPLQQPVVPNQQQQQPIQENQTQTGGPKTPEQLLQELKQMQLQQQQQQGQPPPDTNSVPKKPPL